MSSPSASVNVIFRQLFFLSVIGNISFTFAWLPTTTLPTTTHTILPTKRIQSFIPCQLERPQVITTSTQLYAEQRRFSQPKKNKSRSGNYYKNKNKEKFGADGRIASLHEQRIKTAGRVGTKRFVDPCKVFVGNLPFNVDDKQLKDFILTTMGQSQIVFHSAKVIKDWKTGKSKGYGFCMFNEPIYATVCMETVNGKLLGGRAVTVSQGKKKDQENQLYLKKKKDKPLTDEEAAIAMGIEQANDDDEDDDDIPVFDSGSDEDDLEMDARLFGIVASDEDDDDDDDDDDIDGIFLERHFKYEEVDPDLNREQRRDAQRRLKRKKRPSKGFGQK